MADQVLADLAQRERDMLMRGYGLDAAAADAYGAWLADLAGWTQFLTFTHDPKRLGEGHTIVGRQRHRRVLSHWWHDDVQRLDPGARYFSEMELHESGQAHEHGLLAVSSAAVPVLSMRQAWFDRAGFCDVRPLGVDERSRVARALYVAKYTGKAAAIEPFIGGFGLHRVPTHSVSFGAVMR